MNGQKYRDIAAAVLFYVSGLGLPIAVMVYWMAAPLLGLQDVTISWAIMGLFLAATGTVSFLGARSWDRSRKKYLADAERCMEEIRVEGEKIKAEIDAAVEGRHQAFMSAVGRSIAAEIVGEIGGEARVTMERIDDDELPPKKTH